MWEIKDIFSFKTKLAINFERGLNYGHAFSQTVALWISNKNSCYLQILLLNRHKYLTLDHNLLWYKPFDFSVMYCWNKKIELANMEKLDIKKVGNFRDFFNVQDLNSNISKPLFLIKMLMLIQKTIPMLIKCKVLVKTL